MVNSWIPAYVKLFLLFALAYPWHATHAMPYLAANEQHNLVHQRVHDLAALLKQDDLIAAQVDLESLPSPYNALLTQPLMTTGLTSYYQRTPKIQTLFAKQNKVQKTFSRAIIMLIDKNRIRNNVEIARNKKESIVIELAFITMNFNELPKQIIDHILHDNIPFGQLLADHRIDTLTKDRAYFSLHCTKALSDLIHCKVNSTIYGRTNTLINKKNHRWLARVVEILPGIQCKNARCTALIMQQ
ncbi:hypothetical protein [Legionella spiritensis]|uniref:Uncharacterized protein n=1 Tax=Legionella spiritensis TaxID=452 RepID=A0A0W0YX38_LEGSP|nr:hypothetical protein [Legionella spiritensis]KTD61436.1 hypothetical protein Lspi_2678 [Legionella spiritensis]SNV33941.1 Uncharacterised protein [Legionella spiritensis]